MATKQTPDRLTIKQIMAAFGVSDMTVYTWRQGTATRAPLPVHQDGARVYGKPAELEKWAKKHDLEFSITKALKVPGSVPMGAKKAAPAKKAAAPAKKSAKVVPFKKPVAKKAPVKAAPAAAAP